MWHTIRITLLPFFFFSGCLFIRPRIHNFRPVSQYRNNFMEVEKYLLDNNDFYAQYFSSVVSNIAALRPSSEDCCSALLFLIYRLRCPPFSSLLLPLLSLSASSNLSCFPSTYYQSTVFWRLTRCAQ